MGKIQAKFIFLLCFFSAFFILPVWAFAQTPNSVSAPGGSALGGEKIFYLAPYNAVKGVASVNQNWQDIDILAPQYYTISSKLYLLGKLGPELKQAIADHNLKVMPLITNAGFSQKTIHNLLNSPDVQTIMANSLVKIAKKDNYIGWQFDFENISYKDKDLYTAFVQRAYPIFQKNNLVFSVAVVPRIVDFENTDAFKNWGGAYDYKAISDSCDFVSLMTYDDNNSVGPASSVVFINNVLAYVKDKIPPAKLSLGVPLYYWKWSVASNKKVGVGSYKNIANIMSSYTYNTGFDLNLGVAWLTYFVNKKQYKIWFENQQSFEQKLGIAKNNNLRGFSAWLLGGEDPAIWNFLSQPLAVK